MKNNILVPLIALIFGLALGAGVMAIFGEETKGPSLADESGKTSTKRESHPRVDEDEGRKTRKTRKTTHKPDIVKPKPDTTGKIDEPAYTGNKIELLPENKKSELMISGLVVGPDGSPFGGATLVAKPNGLKLKGGYEAAKLVDKSSAAKKAARRAHEDFIETLNLEVTSKADGSFEFKGLYDASYSITCRQGTNTAVALSTSYVKPGGKVDFAFKEQRSIAIRVLMPDGEEPESAQIAINNASSGGGTSGWNNYYSRKSVELSSLSFSPGYGGYPSGYGASKSLTWTPKNRSVDLSEGIWRLSASRNNYEYISEEINVNALSSGELGEITLNLRKQPTAKIILSRDDEEIPFSQYNVHVRSIEAIDAEVKDFSSIGKYVSHTSNGAFVLKDPELGRQIISVVYNGDVLNDQRVNFGEDEANEFTMNAPGPDRADFVVVDVVGLRPYQRSNLQFRHGYKNGKSNRQNYCSNYIKRSDGSFWIPHYGLKSTTTVPAAAEYWVEVTAYGLGTARKTYSKSSSSRAKLEIEEAGVLRVQLQNFDSENNAHKKVSVSLKRLWQEGEERIGQVGTAGRVDDHGVIFISGITPGEYELAVSFQSSYGAKAAGGTSKIRIRGGLNDASPRVPPLYKLSLRVSEGVVQAKGYRWIQLLNAQSTVKWKSLVMNQKIDFGSFPAGEYKFRIQGKTMSFYLGSDLTLPFTPEN